MGAHPRAINLQFGNGILSNQDAITAACAGLRAGAKPAPAEPCVNKPFQIIPSSRGSHSEISGT